MGSREGIFWVLIREVLCSIFVRIVVSRLRNFIGLVQRILGMSGILGYRLRNLWGIVYGIFWVSFNKFVGSP